jgi:hypothetical protein
MNELKPEDVMKALDILDKMDFFQGQRAGRELWNEKPFEVQNQDIADFSNGIDFIKKLIMTASMLLTDEKLKVLQKDAEIERLNAEIGRLGEQCRVLTIEYPKITRAEAITEFAERLKDTVYGECLINGHKYYVINAISIDQIAKEIKGEDNGKTDL